MELKTYLVETIIEEDLGYSFATTCDNLVIQATSQEDLEQRIKAIISLSLKKENYSPYRERFWIHTYEVLNEKELDVTELMREVHAMQD